MSKELALTPNQQNFIDMLIACDGNVAEAAREVGISDTYGYVLKNKLAKHIAEAAQQYLASHAISSAKKLIEMQDKEMPNPVHLNAINSVLDRAGVKYVSEEDKGPTIKANIFILPEKREIEPIIIDHIP